MKKYYFLIIVALILGLVLTGCSLLSNISQVPDTGQSGITYLTKALPLTNLVGLWHFDGNADDSSGNGLHGNVTGAAFYVDGKFDKALNFDGINDYVKVVDQVGLNVTDYTLELWINANNFTNLYPTLLNRGVQSPTLGYYWIWIKSNCIVLTYSDGTIARSAYWYTPFSTGEWYHIALTKSGSSFTMYKNASSLGAKNLTYMDTVNGDLFIGTYQARTASRYNFDGIIDEVRIWNTALTADQLNFYGFNGLLAPYKEPPKAFKIGSSIPLKWQYTDLFDIVVDSSAADPTVEIKKASDVTALVEGEPILVNDPGSSGYQYDSETNTWQFNWQTKGLEAGIYNIRIISGQTLQVNGPFEIQLK